MAEDCRAACDLPTEVAAMRSELNGIRVGYDKVSEAITRIAVVDERQLEFGKSLDRLFSYIEKVDAERKAESAATNQRLLLYIERVEAERRAEEKALSCRISKLEVAAPENRRAATWVFGGVIAVVGGAIGYVLKKVGL